MQTESLTPEISVLDPFIHQDMRPCANCGGLQVFVEVYEFEHGRMGFCFGCGDERVLNFTRTTGEAG